MRGKTETDGMVYNPAFQRTLDKSAIPTCNILGTEVMVGNMAGLISYVSENLSALSGDYITVAASNEIVMAYEDEQFYRCANGGIMTIPDGAPLVTFGRKHGYPDMERITGPDFMLTTLQMSARTGWRHYFYGSTQETLDRMRERIEREFPGTVIAGMRPSRFRALTEEEDRETVAEINAAKPDFVWFCLGAPKGNYFAAAHQGELSGLLVSVGAAFNYFTGNIKRAPRWMQAANLEWLYRIFQEPIRMLKRYGYIVPKFLYHAYLLGNR